MSLFLYKTLLCSKCRKTEITGERQRSGADIMPPDFARSETEESMKNIRFDLQYFAEGESGCAAEQSANAEAVEGIAEKGSAQMSDGSVSRGEKGDTETVKNIGALLGIAAEDSETLISLINARRARASLDERLKARNAKRAYGELLSEAERLSSKIKGFDMRKELSDRRFAGMLRAGFTLEEAYRAAHTEDIIKETVESAEREALSKALEALQRQSQRPCENGGKRAPSNNQTGVENLTGRGIRDILRRVEKGAKIKF